MKLTKDKQKQLAIECAKSRRTCSGCDWQHLCEDARIARSKRIRKEYIAAMPEWKRREWYPGEC